uniref:Uncharacterized protein AlNc14C90G5663 n=1 Tax=Albugo laibachii Nc14 TaxID=890382 RepID=F0WGD1_9STRA|nr:conserved hypothetical protein [Albugo laibachii Nc14]|eukprot:CCA20292.1 conserved hypothetical protein [Albugo laibachii Nc14]
MAFETLCRVNAGTCNVPEHQESAKPSLSVLLSSLVSRSGSPNGPSSRERISGFSAHLKLRKVESQPLFQNFDEEAFLMKQPAVMMRFVDTLRYHRPTEEERSYLAVPSSKERLCMHELPDILICCGARKGFRFSSKEISGFQYDTQNLKTLFSRLNTAFLAMPSKLSRYKFGSATRIQDFPKLLRLMALDSDEILGRIQSEQERIQFQAFHFQWLAQQYLLHFDHLRNGIQAIRHRFQSSEWHCIAERSSHDLVDPVEVELEAKTQHPFPFYLHVLIQKYHREKRKKETPWTPSSPWQPVDSIVAFADFIIEFLWPTSGRPLALSFEESECVQFLLQILKVGLHSTESFCHCKAAPQDHRGHTTRKAFQKLVYEFLITVYELRHIPRGNPHAHTY